MYLLTCRVSRYYLLALQNSIACFQQTQNNVGQTSSTLVQCFINVFCFLGCWNPYFSQYNPVVPVWYMVTGRALWVERGISCRLQTTPIFCYLLKPVVRGLNPGYTPGLNPWWKGQIATPRGALDWSGLCPWRSQLPDRLMCELPGSLSWSW